jgi:thermostable 8-oxoguanine DNA glycosylase
MIDPTAVTNYNRTDAELEELMLFSIAVAGKTAQVVSKQLQTLLDAAPGSSPFDKIKKLTKNGKLLAALKKSRLGKYGILIKAYPQVTAFNLRTCTADELETVHGIGPKTARFFLLHSRPGIQVAALDTHILKFLKALGHDVPDSTPTGKKYKLLEAVFIEEAKKRGRSIAELDLAIWNHYSKGGDKSRQNPVF